MVSAQAQTLRVMTYNLRFDNPDDGVNRWSMRRQKVVDLIQQYHPEVLGVQEALHHQLEELVQALPQYAYVGVGRDDGQQRGEYSAILYRKDRFKVEEQSTAWLSETPTVPGSKSWDAAITRLMTICRLQEISSGHTFVVINTHFDHIGKEARRQSALMLKKAAARFPRQPIIITGDFNCTRDDAPYREMMDGQLVKLYDPAPASPPGTYCTFAVNAQPCVAIDYIFHTKKWKASGYQVITDNDGKHYPSDHLPVMVDLKL